MDQHNIQQLEYNTPYDDIWRTIVDRLPHLLIPLINEVFHEQYPADEPVTALQNEHMDSAADKVISDTYIRIRDKYYHLECQSNPDGTMAIRMIEYDFLVALKHARKNGFEYTINYPESCVIYLRHKDSTPDFLTVHVNFPDGNRIDYRTPVIKAQKYGLEEIFIKRLLCLLPYYIMKYEKALHEINEDDEKLGELLKEYQWIYRHLMELQREGSLTQYDVSELRLLIEMLLDYIAAKEMKIRKGVTDMGGRVLVFPHDKVYDEGKAAGMAVGKSQGKLEAKKEIAFELFGEGMPCEKIAKCINESNDMVKQLEKEWKSQQDKKAVSV